MNLSHRVEVRVDTKTKEIINDLARAQGLSVSSYVRMLLLKSLADGGHA